MPIDDILKRRAGLADDDEENDENQDSLYDWHPPLSLGDRSPAAIPASSAGAGFDPSKYAIDPSALADARDRQQKLGLIGTITDILSRTPNAAQIALKQTPQDYHVGKAMDQLGQAQAQPFQDQEMLRQNMMQQMQDKALAKSMDPEDQQSTTTGQVLSELGKKQGINIPLGLSAYEYNQNYGPKTAVGTAINERMRESIADKRLQALTANRETKSDNDLEKKIRADEKLTSDLAGKMQKDLDPDVGRAGNFGQISNTFIQSQKLKKLATDANGDIANLPSQQQEELALGMARMLGGGGVSSDARVKALVPQSAVGSVQKFKAWLLNEPEGTNQQAFTKYMMGTINREADLSQQQMKEIQVRRLGAHQGLKNLNAERYNDILDRYGLGQPMPAQAIAPQGPNAPKKQVVKKLYSPSRKQTKMVYSDGSEETLDGQQ